MKNQNQTVKVLNLLLTVLAVLTLFTAACAQEWFETDEENLIEYLDHELYCIFIHSAVKNYA